MNPIDITIGSGLGALITLIIRAVADSKSAKKDIELKRRNKITENFNDLDKRIIDSYCKIVSLESKAKIIIDRIDQHAGRIEKLVEITRPLNEVSVKALHDNYASILIALSKDKKK